MPEKAKFSATYFVNIKPFGRENNASLDAKNNEIIIYSFYSRIFRKAKEIC